MKRSIPDLPNAYTPLGIAALALSSYQPHEITHLFAFAELFEFMEGRPCRVAKAICPQPRKFCYTANILSLRLVVSRTKARG